MRLVCEKQVLAVPNFNIAECLGERAETAAQGARKRQEFDLDDKESGSLENKTGENAQNQPSEARLREDKPADSNRDIYYRNKLEFSVEGGWHPINIPFPLDIFVGDAYNTYPLKYTLVPIFASLRWHMNDVGDLGFCAAILISRSPGLLLRFQGGPSHAISFILWGFAVILSRVIRGSRPTLGIKGVGSPSVPVLGYNGWP